MNIKYREERTTIKRKDNDVVNYKDLGKRIRELRSTTKQSQKELAIDAGLNPDHLSHIETANTHASLKTIVKLANALNGSLDELLIDSLNRPIQDSLTPNERFNAITRGYTAEQINALLDSLEAILKTIEFFK